MTKRDVVWAILWRKWIKKECTDRCCNCIYSRDKCAWGMLICGDKNVKKVKIVLR